MTYNPQIGAFVAASPLSDTPKMDSVGVSTVSSSNVSVPLLQVNLARGGAHFVNAANTEAFIAIDVAASASKAMTSIPPSGQYDLPTGPDGRVARGQVNAIW